MAEARTRTLPLERKLPLVVLGLFTLVLAITLIVSYFEVRNSAIETSSERLTGLVQALGSTVEQQTAARLGALRRAARDTSIIEAFASPAGPLPPGARRALAPLSVAPADSATPPELWDPSGKPLGPPRLETPGDEHPFRKEIVTAPSDSGYVTRLRVANGRASYYDAVPVRDANGALLGFLAQERRINVNPRGLPLLRGLIGADVEFYLRNVDDDTWVRLTGARVPPPARGAMTTEPLAVYDHGESGSVLASTARVRNTPLVLTAERPMTSILARPLATIRALILVSVVLAALGALAVWILSRRLVQPLGAVTRAAEAMAHGRYEERVRVAGDDEIGRLGLAFNRMADEVQASAETSARAVSRLTRSVETQEFLAEASRILAGSVSDETLLPNLARYCVPRLADYCSIHIVDDDGAIRRIETAHRDPSALPVVRSLLARFAYRIDSPGDVPEVIRTLTPMMQPRIDIEGAIRNANDPAVEQLIRVIQPNAMMIVPLVARGRGFGAISFVMTEGRRTFNDEDLELAMELGRRTAVAIDNAVIFRRSVELRLEAEAASSAKSDFLAKMSHEIRTPINAMMGYAELMEMGIAGPINEAQAKHLSRIRASGDHLTALIGEILDLSKIEAGRMSVQAVDASARDAIDASLSIVRPTATAKGVELSLSVDGNADLMYHGDPQRVQQILTNLLSNAVKFTASGGAVQVRCEEGVRPEAPTGARWICITVTDTGVGIEEADIERIFQPFVQVESGYTRSQGGTGLGLTISRNLAHLMGGDITAVSEPGRGSTFTLWLPCAIRAFATG